MVYMAYLEKFTKVSATSEVALEGAWVVAVALAVGLAVVVVYEEVVEKA